MAKAVRRGRPPLPGGSKSQAEVQRAYRARLKAAAEAAKPIDDVTDLPYDPAIHIICERAFFSKMREDYHNALAKLELRGQDLKRLDARNAYLEVELKRVQQHHTVALKDNIVLKQQLAEAKAAGLRRSPPRR